MTDENRASLLLAVGFGVVAIVGGWSMASNSLCEGDHFGAPGRMVCGIFGKSASDVITESDPRSGRDHDSKRQETLGVSEGDNSEDHRSD